jgi:hypothetical protein
MAHVELWLWKVVKAFVEGNEGAVAWLLNKKRASTFLGV